jgi:hypothetical protein
MYLSSNSFEVYLDYVFLNYFILNARLTQRLSMKKTVIAGLTAIAIVGSSLTYAQQQPAPQTPGEHEHHRLSPADLKAFTDARIAALKAGLQLTPDQEKKWPPVEQAIRDMAQARQERMAKRHGEAKSEDAIVRLRRRADAMTERAAQLKKLADAAEPLYQSLTDDQKHRVRFLVHFIREHHGFRHHMR